MKNHTPTSNKSGSIDENIEYFSRLADMALDFLTRLKAEPPEKVDAYSVHLKDPIKALYWKMTVEYGVMYAQMYSQWVEKCKKELEDIRDDVNQKALER